MGWLIVTGKILCRANGFTLIELLVVLSVVGMLLSIGLPRYMRSLEKAKYVVLKDGLASMRLAIDRFHEDKGRFPNSLGELVSDHYLTRIPVDPIVESDSQWLQIPAKHGASDGVGDVRSSATGVGWDGLPYSEY